MKLGMVGLGRMGRNMAARLLRGGHEVVAYNRTHETAETLAREEGAVAVRSLEEMCGSLPLPRVVWLMLPAGAVVDRQVDELIPLLEPGDILVEGANSLFRDDLKRLPRLEAAGIRFVDAGVSGGVWGLNQGYCLMLGGDKDAFDHIEPVLKTLAPAEGYLYCGAHGAGHFVKMVHNGIEYAMMQAYAEGFALLESSDYSGQFDFARISHLWNQGSVIRSWLLELAERAFTASPRLEEIGAWVDDSGTGRWTVQQAVESATPAPCITLALMERFRSRQENGFQDRILTALREQFGGHAVKTGQLRTAGEPEPGTGNRSQEST